MLQHEVKQTIERQTERTVRTLIENGVEYINVERTLASWFGKRGIAFVQIGSGEWVWQQPGGINAPGYYTTFHELLAVILDYVCEHPAEATATFTGDNFTPPTTVKLTT